MTIRANEFNDEFGAPARPVEREEPVEVRCAVAEDGEEAEAESC